MMGQIRNWAFWITVCLFVYWFDSVILNLYLRTFQYKTASFGLVERQYPNSEGSTMAFKMIVIRIEVCGK